MPFSLPGLDCSPLRNSAADNRLTVRPSRDPLQPADSEEFAYDELIVASEQAERGRCPAAIP